MALDPFSIIGSALAGYLGTAGTVPVYQDLAITAGGAPVQPPYLIYALQSGPQVYTWDGEEVQTEYQVKVVSNRENSAEATLLYKSVHDVLQDAPLTMPGSVSLLRCRRSTLVKYQDPKRFWHVGGIYRVDVIR